MKIERIICNECGYRVKPEKIRDEEIATIIDGLSGNEIKKRLNVQHVVQIIFILLQKKVKKMIKDFVNSILRYFNLCWCENCKKIKSYPGEMKINLLDEEKGIEQSLRFIVCQDCIKKFALEQRNKAKYATLNTYDGEEFDFYE